MQKDVTFLIRDSLPFASLRGMPFKPSHVQRRQADESFCSVLSACSETVVLGTLLQLRAVPTPGAACWPRPQPALAQIWEPQSAPRIHRDASQRAGTRPSHPQGTRTVQSPAGLGSRGRRGGRCISPGQGWHSSSWERLPAVRSLAAHRAQSESSWQGGRQHLQGRGTANEDGTGTSWRLCAQRKGSCRLLGPGLGWGPGVSRGQDAVKARGSGQTVPHGAQGPAGVVGRLRAVMSP